MNLNYLKNDFDWDCNVYCNVIRLEEDGIAQAIKELNEYLEFKKEKVNNIATGDLIDIVAVPDHIAKGFGKAMSDLQNATIYNALFIMNISYLEFALTEICRLASIYLKINFYTYKTSDRGLDKSRTFLKETLGIDISTNKNWSDFKINANVRNCFAHNNANIVVDYDKPLENQPYYDAFTINKNFNLTKTGFLFINSIDYIKKIHADETSFISEIFNQMKDTLKKNLKNKSTTD